MASHTRPRIPSSHLLLLLFLVGSSPAEAQTLEHVDTVFGTTLRGNRSVVVSPDSAHVYAAAFFDDALVVYSRDVVTSTLSLVQSVRNGVAGIEGLHGIESVAMSSDGAHVYAASSLDAAVAVFSRDAGTGLLSPVELERDGIGGVTGIADASFVTLAPDGAHVYIASPDEDTIAVFARDAGTGALGFVGTHVDGIGGFDALDGVADIALSSDGAFLYTAASDEDAVGVFDRDPITGLLGFIEAQRDGQAGVDGLADAMAVALSPDGTSLHAAGAGDDGIATFARDAGTGTLSFASAVFTPGGGQLSGVNDVQISADGLSAYTTGPRYGAGDGAVTALSRNPGTGELAIIGWHFPFTVPELPTPFAIAVSPDDGSVYAASSEPFSGSPGALHAFERDPASGVLTHVESETAGSIGAVGMISPTDAQVSPDGAHVYVASSIGDAVTVFSRDPATGTLSFVEAEEDGTGGASGLDGANGIAISPDGAQVYVIAGLDAALTVFGRDAASGGITPLETHFDGTAGVEGLVQAKAIVASQDGAHVYVSANATVGGHPANSVAIFARDAGTGLLSFVDAFDPIFFGAVDPLVISRDGAHLYTFDNQLEMLGRDAGTGLLTSLGRVTVSGITALALSPDDLHVYGVTGNGKIARFARDPVTGLLTQIGFPSTISGLLGATDVVVSLDGAQVYAVSELDHAAVAMTRDEASGAVSFVEAHVDVSAGGAVPGLDEPLSVATSPDGAHLYVAGGDEHSLVIFARRDCANGSDDDGDGDVDFPADAGCSHASDASERPACDDGLDNDGDGLVDFPSDPGCRNAQPGLSFESPECDDGVDNDADTLIDAADPQCAASPGWWDDESKKKSSGCGLGFELIGLAGLLRARRSIRRSAG